MQIRNEGYCETVNSRIVLSIISEIHYNILEMVGRNYHIKALSSVLTFRRKSLRFHFNFANLVNCESETN